MKDDYTNLIDPPSNVSTLKQDITLVVSGIILILLILFV